VKKGKAQESTACAGQISASVLLKLFISSKDIYHTTDTQCFKKVCYRQSKRGKGLATKAHIIICNKHTLSM